MLGAGNGDCDYCDRTFATDLTPYFTESIRTGVLTGAWMVEAEKKELLLKFDDCVSRPEKLVYMELIGRNLIEMAAQQDEDGEEDYSFRDFIDGMQIREWEAADEERIRNGIPHEITH